MASWHENRPQLPPAAALVPAVPADEPSWQTGRANDLERLVIEIGDALVKLGNVELIMETLRREGDCSSIRETSARLRSCAADLTSEARGLRVLARKVEEAE